MNINKLLEKHSLWLQGNGGEQANLSRAYLSRVNLTGANLGGADLSGADLSGADLTGVNLSGADLSGAYLTGANLGGADLSGADLSGADLNGTCLDPDLLLRQRRFCRECPPVRTGGRIVYRTARSQHVGSQEYLPGHTYTAPHLSFDCNTDCHPGIYAGYLRQIQEQYPRDKYPSLKFVRCYVRDGDWASTRKGIRCKKLRILNYVEDTRV